MGNFNSCISVQTQFATLVDPKGNIRQIQLPITAAEIMLDHLGQIISPADQIRLTRQLPAINAEKELSAGKLYLLVPANRIHTKVSPSEMALIDSVICKKRQPKRRSTKVSPAVTDDSTKEVEAPVALWQGKGAGLTGQRAVCPGQWKPVLEPIREESRGYLQNKPRSVR